MEVKKWVKHSLSHDLFLKQVSVCLSSDLISTLIRHSVILSSCRASTGLSVRDIAVNKIDRVSLIDLAAQSVR